MSILVTGAAGFIGFHTIRRLLGRGEDVVGIDNLNDYYPVQLKLDRLGELRDIGTGSFTFVRADFTDPDALQQSLRGHEVRRIVHLGAQAGVRYSLQNPHSYVHSNVTGTLNVLEGCRHNGVEHLVYASTSSVYGANTDMPFSPHRIADHPLTIYAATKRSNELMAHTYSSLFNLPTTGLRFFTVYGPWGRPDMALFLFTRNILEGKPIEVFNNGHHRRDFTYVEDIAEGVARACEQVAQPSSTWDSGAPDPATSRAPFRLYNIGNHQPVELLRYIEVIEQCLGRKAEKHFLPLQLGDVPDTFADIEDLARDVGYRPATPVAVGVRRFVDWFCEYYGYKTG